MKKYRYLALGDSYTIGESVAAADNFPQQLIQLLRKGGYDFESPDIVAKTGWTTEDLQNEINKHIFHPPYDIVTLLIGVNNQYRGKAVDEYKPEFETLLLHAIQYAGNKPDHVIILSIPDWSVTPFVAGRNRIQIANEIDAFNNTNKSICENLKVHYLNITPGTREASDDRSLIAADGLHPSGKEYGRWANQLKIVVEKLLI